ncbi:MAG: hypothetical protein K6T83_09935 [Alicyclobacillus sp.]|nr:hypothetical protein [Alicyclobacillus sp.]
MVEICRALVRDAQILILDEPTASLSQIEANELHKIMRQLVQQGVAVLYVSHRLEEVLQLADRITVQRNGQLVGTCVRGEFTPEMVVEMMVGRVVDLSRGDNDMLVSQCYQCGIEQDNVPLRKSLLMYVQVRSLV